MLSRSAVRQHGRAAPGSKHGRSCMAWRRPCRSGRTAAPNVCSGSWTTVVQRKHSRPMIFAPWASCRIDCWPSKSTTRAWLSPFNGDSPGAICARLMAKLTTVPDAFPQAAWGLQIRHRIYGPEY